MSARTLAKTLRQRIQAHLAGAGVYLEDVVGVAGAALVVGGVRFNWGAGWALIAAGVPLVALYVWRELSPRKKERA